VAARAVNAASHSTVSTAPVTVWMDAWGFVSPDSVTVTRFCMAPMGHHQPSWLDY
jgi:hypothetical protein